MLVHVTGAVNVTFPLGKCPPTPPNFEIQWLFALPRRPLDVPSKHGYRVGFYRRQWTVDRLSD
jgi:hypothetical protein